MHAARTAHGVAKNPRLLLVVRFVQGLGAAALSTVSITLVARHFVTCRGRAFGVYNAIKGSGHVIAPAAGGLLASRYGFGTIFIASASIGLLALIASLFLPTMSPNSLNDCATPMLAPSCEGEADALTSASLLVHTVRSPDWLTDWDV